MGVTVRGIVDDERGTVVLGSTPEWTGMPVGEYLQARMELPVYVENDVRAATLAEYTHGGKEFKAAGACCLFV